MEATIIDKDIVAPQVISGALIGGLVVAGVARAGLDSIVWPGVIKTASAIVLSP
jgi:PiT family inorganic phosphate transporter